MLLPWCPKLCCFVVQFLLCDSGETSRDFYHNINVFTDLAADTCVVSVDLWHCSDGPGFHGSGPRVHDKVKQQHAQGQPWTGVCLASQQTSRQFLPELCQNICSSQSTCPPNQIHQPARIPQTARDPSTVLSTNSRPVTMQRGVGRQCFMSRILIDPTACTRSTCAGEC